MYDLPQLHDANAALRGALSGLLAAEGVEPGPAAITQVCGYPLQTTHRGQFTLLAIPHYDVRGCEGPEHRAFIVVRSASAFAGVQDLRGTTFAVNSMDSNTGMNLPRHLFASLANRKPFFHQVTVTGSHRDSMAAVLGGRADSAAIDCVTLGLQAEYDPGSVEGLRIIASTSPSPCIPFVTSRSTDSSSVAAMQRALATFSTRARFAQLRRALRIDRIEAPCAAAYNVLLAYRAEAAALGYPLLA